MRYIALPAAVLCLAASGLFAQTIPADPNPLLEKLAIPASHDAALDQLKKLPAAAIVPLFDAVNEKARSEKIRDDIAAAIDAIATRERSAAAREDASQKKIWASATGLIYYRKLSSNPKWDAEITRGLQRIDQKNPAGLDDLKQAFDAGCTDPWIHAIYAYHGFSFGRTDAIDAARKFVDLIPGLETSGYPDSRKIAVISDFLSLSVKADNSQVPYNARQQALAYAITHFKDLIADHPGHTLTRSVAASLYNAGKALHRGSAEGGKEVIDALSAALPNDSLSYFFKANFYTEWAWEARGGGFAGSVTDDGWKLFNDRLDQAKKFAGEGWRKNPLDPDCPTVMIQVCMGQSADRPEMESWFSRAVLADPHNYMACAAKEQYLLPRWEGSEKEALDFGRFCVAHGNADDRLPTILIQTYKDLLQLAPNMDETTTSPEYWTDIQSVYQKLLADKSRLQTHRTQYLTDRANYIKAACDARHWKDAAALMDQFGNEININVFGGQALYDYEKQKAAAAAGKSPGP